MMTLSVIPQVLWHCLPYVFKNIFGDRASVTD